MPVEPDLRAEGGFTLIELSIVLLLFSVVIAAVLGALSNAQTTVARAEARNTATDEAHRAMEQIDRQVRSGNLLYDPALENNPGAGITPGFALRVYTQSNSLQRCRQWRVTAGKLEARAWTTSWAVDGNVSPWHTVAEGIVNTSTQPVFVLPPGYAGRLIDIRIITNKSGSASGPIEFKSSVTGRNTEYGYPSTVCATTPP